MKATTLILALCLLGTGAVLATPGVAATPCPEGSMLDVGVLIACANRHVEDVLDDFIPPEQP